MSRYSNSGRFWVVILLTFVLPLAAFGAPAPADKVYGTDAFGDSLPVGALARLGTERLTIRSDILVFSPDGKTLASGAPSGSVCLWQTDSGKEVRRFQAPTGAERRHVYALAFSPDGKLIVLGYQKARLSNDPGIYIWNVRTGEQVQTFEILKGSPRYFAFSADGKILAASCDESILLFDLVTGKEVAKFEARGPVAFADEDKTLVNFQELLAKENKDVIHLWDVAEKKERIRHELKHEKRQGYHCAISSNGKIIAMPMPTEDGKVISLIDAATGKELCRTEEKEAEPWNVVFTPDGALLAVSDGDGMIRVYDAATGKVRHRYRGHTKWVGGLAISADGKLLASSASKPADNAVHLWDLGKEKELLSFVGHRSGPLTVAFLPDGKTVATVSHEESSLLCWTDWSLRLWDAASGKEIHAVKESQGAIEVATFSRDGSRLATLRHDGTLRVWDVHEGNVLKEWIGPTREIKKIGIVYNVVYTLHAVSGIALAPDGGTLVTAGYDKTLRFWEVKTGKELRNQEMEFAFDSRCLYSPDGKTLAVVVEVGSRPRSENVVILLDSTTGHEIRRLPATQQILALAFSDDGKAIAVSERDTVLIAEISSGGNRVEYKVQFTSGLVFSPDGRVLATGKWDGTIQFWHTDSAKPLCSLTANLDCVRRFAFSRDGKRLASAGNTNTAYIWDVADVLRGKLPEPVKLSPEDLEAAWDGLADPSAAKAFVSRNKLVDGAQSVPWLVEKAKAFRPIDSSRLDKWVKDLGSDDSDVRHKASENLVILGFWAGPAVRKALAGDLPSEEARRRAKEVLDKLRSPQPECLREIRTLEVLEQIGTPDAQKALEKLAEGSGPRQDDAKACLERLKRRGVK
jgi:WD40 repeat protein